MTRRQRMGFTLMELLAAIIMLGTFTAVASKLYIATFDTLKQTRDAANAAAHARHIERSLHADAWNAQRIACPRPDRAEIDLPGNRSVVWLCSQEELTVDLQRRLMVDDREVYRDTFTGFGDSTQFATDGVTLRLTRGEVELTCVSRLQLMRRAQR